MRKAKKSAEGTGVADQTSQSMENKKDKMKREEVGEVEKEAVPSVSMGSGGWRGGRDLRR